MKGAAPLTSTPLRSKLADIATSVRCEDLPQEVKHQAKRCVLDLLGVALAGSGHHLSEICRRVAFADGGKEEASVWGSRSKRLPATAAMMVNAVQGHVLDMDDGNRFANGHPGVVTISPAFALAERQNLTGRDLIEAIVVGYEIFVRLASAINPELLLRGFHTTSTVGSCASAAVVSKLLKLPGPAVENALSLAALQGSGLLEVMSSGQMGKSIQVGSSVRNGAFAALLAEKGAEGPVLAFEGCKGFFSTLAGKECPAFAMSDDADLQYQIMRGYLKEHAACRHTHPVLDAVSEIMRHHRPDPAAIVSIEVETYQIARDLTCGRTAQASGLAAKFDLPLAVGLLLTFGRTDPSIFTDRNVSHPQVRSLAERVVVHVSPRRDSLYPQQRGCKVTITTDAQEFSREVHNPKGEPEYPLTDEDVIRKFEQNAQSIIAHDQSKRLWESVFNMDGLYVRQLTEMLAPSSARS